MRTGLVFIALMSAGCAAYRVVPGTAPLLVPPKGAGETFAQIRQQAFGRGYVSLNTGTALRVVSPVVKPGGTVRAGEIVSVTQGGAGSINVDLKAGDDVMGYEISWYDIAGRRITARPEAEVHVGGKTELRPPAVNQFPMGPRERYFRLFMMTKVSENDFDFAVVGGETPAQLEERTARFQRDAAGFLRTADKDSYAVLPHGAGVNAYVRVSLNGKRAEFPAGTTLGQAAKPALRTLKVQKYYGDRLYPVRWPKISEAILDLPLEGGEVITW